jgi:hypothetical protein
MSARRVNKVTYQGLKERVTQSQEEPIQLTAYIVE